MKASAAYPRAFAKHVALQHQTYLVIASNLWGSKIISMQKGLYLTFDGFREVITLNVIWTIQSKFTVLEEVYVFRPCDNINIIMILHRYKARTKYFSCQAIKVMFCAEATRLGSQPPKRVLADPPAKVHWIVKMC